ncbi:MAG: hypothetical protein HXO25_04820, partial [Prevotella sp.]|nr:hypothetical protein [Prevotella sp.]
MKKIFLLLQLVMLVVFASCSSEDPDPIPQPDAEVENTIFVYMPWSAVTNDGVVRNNLYNFFNDNLEAIKQAVEQQGGLGNKQLIVFISDSLSKGYLYTIKYKNRRCINDTLAVYNNTLSGLRLNTTGWITSILKRVKQEAPAKNYSLIVGCHGMGWIPGKPSTRLTRSVASPIERDIETDLVGPPTRWFGGGDYQTDISTLAKGIEDSGIGKFQYILFDDCNMTGVEVAYELRDATHYIVGCPTEIMAYGMPYKLLWNELSKVNPNYRNICNTFINFYSNYTYNGSPYPYGTISVIDCSQVEGMVNLMKEINTSSSLSPFVESNLQSMDGYNPTKFYDMGDYVRTILHNDPLLLA